MADEATMLMLATFARTRILLDRVTRELKQRWIERDSLEDAWSVVDVRLSTLLARLSTLEVNAKVEQALHEAGLFGAELEFKCALFDCAVADDDATMTDGCVGEHGEVALGIAGRLAQATMEIPELGREGGAIADYMRTVLDALDMMGRDSGRARRVAAG